MSGRHSTNKYRGLARGKILRTARQLLGLNGSSPLLLVAQLTAAKLSLPVPISKRDRYKLLASFVSTAPYSDPPKPSQPRTLRSPFTGDVTSNDFLMSYDWTTLRMRVIKARGARCECCGATPKDGVRINVDHIKPRRYFPALALEESNLQVLCELCNKGKGNWDQTDWRQQPDQHVSIAQDGTPHLLRPRLVKPKTA